MAKETMKLDLPRFFKACNPSRVLAINKLEEQKYYIDFSSVRGRFKSIEELNFTPIA
jgi:hypothetical protein